MGVLSRVLAVCALRTAAFFCVGGIALHLSAEPDSLTLEKALQYTLQSSPQLAIYPFEQRAAEARVLQAGLRPNPELALEVENVAGSGDLRGTRSAEYTLSLSQTVELGNKRQLRLNAAHRATDSTEQAYALARLEVLAETTRRYIETAHRQALQTWTQTQVHSTEKALAGAQRRKQAGAVSMAEVDGLRIAVMRAQLDVQRASSEVDVSCLRLASSWGAVRADFSNVRNVLFAFPALPALSMLQARVQASPQVAQYLSRARLREAQLRLAESGATPDINVGLGVRRLQESGDNALVFNFSMPLQINNRNQGGIAQARAEMERGQAEEHLGQIDINLLLHTFYAQAQSSQREALLLKNTALPLAESRLREMQNGYSTGRYSALELIAAQNERQAIERDSIEAASRFHFVMLELERLTGQPMTHTTLAEK